MSHEKKERETDPLKNKKTTKNNTQTAYQSF